MNDKRINIVVRDTELYNKAIDEIGLILEKHKFNYIEAYGVLQCVKDSLQEMSFDEE